MRYVIIVLVGLLAVISGPLTLAQAGESPTISSEDTLRWENLSLKMQLHQERLLVIQQQVGAAQNELERERKALDEHFQAAYKVPLAKLQRKDGKWSVIPDPPKAAEKK